MKTVGTLLLLLEPLGVETEEEEEVDTRVAEDKGVTEDEWEASVVLVV
jgi:hypothetical protein